MGSLDLVGDQIAEDVAHIDAALHRVLTKIRVFDGGAGWAQQGFRSCAGWLSWRVGWSANTAREHVRVANALAALPKIDRALEHAEVSYSKVRAMTRVATPDNEHVLLELAQSTTGAQLEALCRKYASVRDHDDPKNSSPQNDLERRYVTRRDREDGMVVIEAVLHPDEAARVWVALERVAKDRCRARNRAASNASAEAPGTEVSSSVSAEASDIDVTSGASAEAPRADVSNKVSAEAPVGTPSASNPTTSPNATAEAVRRPVPFDRADALVEIAEQVLRGDSPSRSPTEVVVSVPLEALQAPDAAVADPSLLASTADGTGLSMHAIRRLACDCGVVPLIEDAKGNPLRVGRKLRVIAGALKRALFNRDTTCRFPGCRARAFLEGHHMQHWLDGGETVISNMLALCSFHHRFVHEYGFTLELDPTTSTVTAYDTANHRSISTLPPAPDTMRPDLGWSNIHARNDRFAITAETQSCWDNTPVDYPEAVDWLLRTDDRARAPADLEPQPGPSRRTACEKRGRMLTEQPTGV